MVQVGTSFPSQRGTRFMTSHQPHQHGSDEDWRVGFGPKASCKCPTAFAWLVLGNIYLTISKHVKQQVPRAATLCDAQRRASYQTQAPSSQNTSMSTSTLTFPEGLEHHRGQNWSPFHEYKNWDHPYFICSQGDTIWKPVSSLKLQGSPQQDPGCLEKLSWDSFIFSEST